MIHRLFFRVFGALCLTLPVLTGIPVPALALPLPPSAQSEPASAALVDSGNPAESGESDDLEWMEVSSARELGDLLKKYRGEPLSLRLINDITLETDEQIAVETRLYFPVQQLDMGGFSITVRGQMTLPYQLRIRGAGGERGMFQVEPGGYLELYGTDIASEDGWAVRQKDGGIFFYDTLGGLRPAPRELFDLAKPIAWPNTVRYGWNAIAYTVLREGENPADVLPQTVEVSLYADGKYVDDATEVPVIWHLEEFSDQLHNQERFVLTGELPDLLAFKQPICYVTFWKDNPAVFTKLRGDGDEEELTIQGQILKEYPDYPIRLEFSTDNKTWRTFDRGDEWLEYDGYADFWLLLEDITFPLYLAAAVQFPDGTTRYSDTIEATGDGSFNDYGGNRGGGSDLGNGGSLPPITSPPPISSGSDESDGGGSLSGAVSSRQSDASSAPEPPAVPGASPPPSAGPPSGDANDQLHTGDSDPDAAPRKENDRSAPTPPPVSSGAAVPAAAQADPIPPVKLSPEAAAAAAASGVLLAAVVGAAVCKPQLLCLLQKLLRHPRG